MLGRGNGEKSLLVDIISAGAKKTLTPETVLVAEEGVGRMRQAAQATRCFEQRPVGRSYGQTIALGARSTTEATHL